jgi:tripartite-type tricarboxylate transporter receptor subunit TctC
MTLRILTAIAALFVSIGCAAQDNYPNKPIRLIVPYPPGGVADAVARMIQPGWSAALGQPVVIDNRGGAGSNIGLDAVAKSAPDGYTVGFFDTALVINPTLYPTMPYDAQRDLVPVSVIARGPLVLVVNPSFPARTVAELVAIARTKPGSISYASAGNGTIVHLAAEMLKASAGIDMAHIPYKGAGAAITDAIGGQVPVLFAVPGTALPHIRSGRLRALAVTGDVRFKSLPDVPTLSEAGVQGVGSTIIVGLVVPAKTPRAIVARLHDTVAKVIATREVTDKLDDFGLSVVAADSDRAAPMIADEIAMWGKVVRSSGAKVE